MAGNRGAHGRPEGANAAPEAIANRDAGNVKKLGIKGRFYIYVLHGIALEIIFRSLHGLLTGSHQCWKLSGDSSVWSMLTFGSSALLIEFLYTRFFAIGIPIIFRCLVYLLWFYFWEFTSGMILRTFNACPWDSSAYSVHKLVTYGYAPVWFLYCLVLEQHIIKPLGRLQWGPEPPPEPRLQDDISMFIRGFLTDPGPGCCQGRHRCSRHSATHAGARVRGTQMGPFFGPPQLHQQKKED